MDLPYNQICLFGDSITQVGTFHKWSIGRKLGQAYSGWGGNGLIPVCKMSFDPKLQGFGASLANAYSRKFDVVNRGFAGYNSEWGLSILKQVLPTVERQQQGRARLVLITVLFGANDSALPFALQHLPLERYRANLTAMIDMIQSPTSAYYNPSLRVILITPPPLNEPQWRKRCESKGDPMNRTAADAARYAQAVRDIAQARGGNEVVLADFWTRLMERAGDRLADFLTDGLHLSANGNEVMYELLTETIAKHFPELEPDRLEMELPWFGDLPRQNFESKLQFPLLRKKEYE